MELKFIMSESNKHGENSRASLTETTSNTGKTLNILINIEHYKVLFLEVIGYHFACYVQQHWKSVLVTFSPNKSQHLKTITSQLPKFQRWAPNHLWKYTSNCIKIDVVIHKPSGVVCPHLINIKLCVSLRGRPWISTRSKRPRDSPKDLTFLCSIPSFIWGIGGIGICLIKLFSVNIET